MLSGTFDLSCWPGEHCHVSIFIDTLSTEQYNIFADIYNAVTDAALCTALLYRLCPNSTGADIRSVCTEAGMYAIRARRKTVTEKDFLDAVQKVGIMQE